MSNVSTRTGCPSCIANGGDNSADNLAIYDDGHGYCYAEERRFSEEELIHLLGYEADTFVSAEKNSAQKSEGIPPPSITCELYPCGSTRGISSRVLEKYGVVQSKKGDTYFPYNKDETAYKIRLGSVKDFRWHNKADAMPLFGMHLFTPGEKGVITITEGEFDALAMFQAVKNPVVSVSSAGAAKKEVGDAYDYLMSFNLVRLALDNDDAGRKATEALLELLPPYKTAVVDLGAHKDANDVLRELGVDSLKSAWQAATPIATRNIVSTREDIRKALEEEPCKPIANFPFPTLDGMVDGIREGEFIYILADTGIGKTTFMRAVEHSVLTKSPYNIGIFHLEEQKTRVIEGLIGYNIRKPLHIRAVADEYSIDDKMDMWDALLGSSTKDRVYIYDSFGGSVRETIDHIRFMATHMECKIIFLDHTSMLVTGIDANLDERRELDRLTQELAILAQELQIAIIAVHHTNDDGRARGSRNVEKVAHTLIRIERDVEAETEEERDKTFITVRKARQTGITGPAGSLRYLHDKGILIERMEE